MYSNQLKKRGLAKKNATSFPGSSLFGYVIIDDDVREREDPGNEVKKKKIIIIIIIIIIMRLI